MASRDGDGWIDCSCGKRHWGLHGAAGLLLLRDQHVLLQHRAAWVHNGDTWGIPGGARDSHEEILECATREAGEELGITPGTFTPFATHTDDHGSWRYDTFLAHAHPELTAHALNDESAEIEWVLISEVASKHLHPAFAQHWPTLLEIISQR